MMKKLFNSPLMLAVAVVVGLICGAVNAPGINETAKVLSQLFINLLKLVSLPIIFLSIVSTATGMESISEFKYLGKKVLKYTLLTTVIAATIALGLFVLINPVNVELAHTSAKGPEIGDWSYLSYLISVIPSNIIQPFAENNVVGVLFIAMVLSLAIITVPAEKRKQLNIFFSGLYAAVMKVTTWVVKLMPFAIWAFITLFLNDLRQGLQVQNVALYLAVVVLANFIQGVVVLPLLLKARGISPLKTAKGMMPALSIAFF